MAAKKEGHPKFGIVAIAEHHQRCSGYRIYTKSQAGMRPFDRRERCQDMFDGAIDTVTLLRDDTNTKRLDALSKEGVELVEGCLRNPDVPHVRDGATPRLAR